MQNEATNLVRGLSPIRPIRDILEADAVMFILDHLAAALCVVLKFVSYWLNYLSILQEEGYFFFVFHITLSEVANRAVPVLWCEISLSFEAAVFQQVNSEFQNFMDPDGARTIARKANRKAAALPDIFQISLEFMDQFSANFTAFFKAGYSLPLASGASAAMVCLPLILQLRTRHLVSQVSAARRRKENEIVTGTHEIIFHSYGQSVRALAQSKFFRQSSVILAFGIIALAAKTHEPHYFVMALHRTLHADDKVTKLWKALTDAKPAWTVLRKCDDVKTTSGLSDVPSSSLIDPPRQPRFAMRVATPNIWSAMWAGFCVLMENLAQLHNIWKAGFGYKRRARRATATSSVWKRTSSDNAGNRTDFGISYGATNAYIGQQGKHSDTIRA